MASKNVGEHVIVRGIPMLIVHRRLITEGKNFGKSMFTLRDNNDDYFRVLGKAVQHNSVLHRENT